MNLGICGLQNGQSHILTLSDCHPVKYTCNNGLCIDLSRKCDGLIDCDDGTDELCIRHKLHKVVVHNSE